MNKENKLLLFGAIAIIILLVVYLKFADLSEYNYELSPLEKFCKEVCREKDIVYFENNTEYNYIKCECASEIVLGDGKYSSVASLHTIDFYFDSKTLKEISKEEVEKKKG